MTPRESRIIVVTALRWSREVERRRSLGADAPTRVLRRRECELLKACALASAAEIVQPSAWRRLVDLVLGVALHKSPASGEPSS